jgi:cytochrome c biogenesis protein CcmG/thiol:disulfide interchange protein DsbE
MWAVVFVAACLLVAACGSNRKPTEDVSTGPTGPKALRQLKAQANQLLDGGPAAYKGRLGQLRGYPVVVNQWASWCNPCRDEFPFFQRLAKKYEGRVAFLGVDSQDARDDAADFLKEFPVPYPHYYDSDTAVARTFGGGRAWPTTAFYDRSGKLTETHFGAYATEAKLEEDIRTYALRD